jgi:hypothetical protein
MVSACVLDGVAPHSVVHADGGGEVGGVICDRGGWWWYRCYNGLLERLEAL